jgi:hypothetical protein
MRDVKSIVRFVGIAGVLLLAAGCIKKESATKAIGGADQSQREELNAGGQVSVPLLFQEAKWRDSGMIISCLYQQNWKISSDAAGTIKMLGADGPVELINEKGVVWPNLVFSSIAKAREYGDVVKNDPERRKNILLHLGTYGIMFLAKRTMNNGTQVDDETENSTSADANSKTSGNSLAAPAVPAAPAVSDSLKTDSPSTGTQSGQATDLESSGIVGIKEQALNSLNQGVQVSKEVASLVWKVQSDGLQEGEVKGFVDPMSFAIFRAVVAQAGRDSKYQACSPTFGGATPNP